MTARDEDQGDMIVRLCAERYGITVRQIRGASHLRRLYYVRRVCALYLLRRGWSSERIGFALNRDGSTVRYYYRKFMPDVERDVLAIEAEITANAPPKVERDWLRLAS